MCPILKAVELSSIVDGAVFLKEEDVATRGHAGAPSLAEGASVKDAALWCLDRLSAVLLEEWQHKVPGTPARPPLTGILAPVDVAALHADPACTVEYFSDVLRAWGIGSAGPAVVARGVPDAVRHLDMETASLRGMHHRVEIPGGRAFDWMLHYVPFSMLSGEVGLLFAFSAAQD